MHRLHRVEFVVCTPVESDGVMLDVLTANGFGVLHADHDAWAIAVSRQQFVNRRQITRAREEVDRLVRPFGGRLVLAHVVWRGRQRVPRPSTLRRAAIAREKQRILDPCSTTGQS